MELQKFALSLKKIVLDAIYIEEKSRENRLKYEKKVFRLISKNYKDGEVKTMCKRLSKHLNSLFTFLEYDVEFSNNRAERAVRPCVVARKISYGSRSKKGAFAFCNHEIHQRNLQTERQKLPGIQKRVPYGENHFRKLDCL